MLIFKKILRREILYFIALIILSFLFSYFIEKYKAKIELEILQLERELNIKNANYYNSQYLNDPKFILYKNLKKEKIYLGSFEYFNNYYNSYEKAQKLYYKLSAQNSSTLDSIEERVFIDKFFKKDWALNVLEKITYDYNREMYGENFRFNHNKISKEDYYYRLLKSEEYLKASYERTIKLRRMSRILGMNRFKELLSFDNPLNFKKHTEFSRTTEFKKIKDRIDKLKKSRKKIDSVASNNYLLSVYFLFICLFVIRYFIYGVRWCVENLN